MKKFLKKSWAYFKESREELTKVVWPTRKQVIDITIVVVILVLIIGFLLGIFDYILSEILIYLTEVIK